MSHQALIENTIAFVKKELANAEGGHDWFHVERVYKNALLISQKEAVNLLIVQLAALLHDIADSKFHNGDENIGPYKAKVFLTEEGVNASVIKEVIHIIKHLSFKGGNFTVAAQSLEFKVVQDADRLDAIGAIGIARAFNYGGFKNRALYNPEIAPNLLMNKEEYKNSTAPSINHFYEKLLLLADRMHTSTAKEIAKKRHQYMENFLEQFYSEWNGKA